MELVSAREATLSELARRWRLSRKRLAYLCDTRDIRPSTVVACTGLYGPAEQGRMLGCMLTLTGRGKRYLREWMDAQQLVVDGLGFRPAPRARDSPAEGA
jgi:hypothetical protein